MPCSPDGSFLAVPDLTHDVRLLDLDTLDWIGTDSPTLVDGPLYYAGPLHYAPDGSQFAMIQQERVRLWDGRTGEYLASLTLPESSSGLSMSYLPNGSGLLVAARDGRTWTVNTRIGTWVTRACEIAGRNLTQAEWQEFFPTSPYRVTCPQWPAGT